MTTQKTKPRQRLVRVFFYGSFMDPSILAQKGLRPRRLDVGCVKDWSIGFTPFATMFPKKGDTVWGVTCRLPPSRLEQVYGAPLFGNHKYFPEAVIVSTRDGIRYPALTYVSSRAVGRTPDGEYLGRLARIARQRRFPKTYIATLNGHGKNPVRR